MSACSKTSCPRRGGHERAEDGTQRQVGPTHAAPTSPDKRPPGGTGAGVTPAPNGSRSLTAEGASFGRICVSAPNWKPKTIGTADCLYVLRGMNTGVGGPHLPGPAVQLEGGLRSPDRVQGRRSRVQGHMVSLRRGRGVDQPHGGPVPGTVPCPAVRHDTSDKSYLAYMAARLLEMRRVLKPTGSVYLHCDPTMGAYLKLVMDAIFGRANFRNEIIWCYRGGGVPRKDFARKHDTILRYSKGKQVTFNVDAVRVPYSGDSQERLQFIEGGPMERVRTPGTCPQTVRPALGGSWPRRHCLLQSSSGRRASPGGEARPFRSRLDGLCARLMVFEQLGPALTACRRDSIAPAVPSP